MVTSAKEENICSPSVKPCSLNRFMSTFSLTETARKTSEKGREMEATC